MSWKNLGSLAAGQLERRHGHVAVFRRSDQAIVAGRRRCPMKSVATRQMADKDIIFDNFVFSSSFP
jgi:hypothetical protein